MFGGANILLVGEEVITNIWRRVVPSLQSVYMIA